MIILVTDTPSSRDGTFIETIEVTTLEELFAYISKDDFSVILHQPSEDQPMWVLEFYTSYRE